MDSYRLLLQDTIGILGLNLDWVERYDLYSDDHYGRSYLVRDSDEVILEAHQNDAEVRVLELARENSILKKQLAQKGKWDIFGRLDGIYDYDGNEDNEGYSGYNVGVGVEVEGVDGIDGNVGGGGGASNTITILCVL